MGKTKVFPIQEKGTKGSQKYLYEALMLAQIAHHKENKHLDHEYLRLKVKD